MFVFYLNVLLAFDQPVSCACETHVAMHLLILYREPTPGNFSLFVTPNANDFVVAAVFNHCFSVYLYICS